MVDTKWESGRRFRMLPWLALATGLVVGLVATAAARWHGSASSALATTGWVTGPSMAPTLLGSHQLARCMACAFSWPIAVPAGNTLTFLACPNCLTRGPMETIGRPLPGERVELVPPASGPPRRWDIVAVDGIQGEPGLVIKRVLGLPGERVTLRDGDVWIDGRRAPRPWEVTQQMMVLVHDDRHRASGERRWQATADTTRWEAAAHGYRWTSGATVSAAVVRAGWDELCFQTESITDELAYNMASHGRVHRVRDGALTGRVRTSDPGSRWRVQWRSEAESDGAGEGEDDGESAIQGETWWMEVDVAGATWSAWRNGQLQARAPLDDAAHGEFAWMICDGRQRWYFNGRLIWEGAIGAGKAARQPWSVSASAGELIIDRLSVWRDVYYAPVAAWAPDWIYATGPDELFLMGDNVASSWDSRHAGFCSRMGDVRARVVAPRRADVTKELPSG